MYIHMYIYIYQHVSKVNVTITSPQKIDLNAKSGRHLKGGVSIKLLLLSLLLLFLLLLVAAVVVVVVVVVVVAVAAVTVISRIFEELNFIIGTPFILGTPKIVVLELRLFSIACSIGGPGWSGGFFVIGALFIIAKFTVCMHAYIHVNTD